MTGVLYTLKNLLSSPFAWVISGNSVKGAGREQNEDSISYAQDDHSAIAILADGVGGQNAGEVASDFLCTELKAWFAARSKALDSDEAEQQLKAAITAIHNKMYQQSREQTTLAGMATTLALVLQFRRSAILAWAGDSRIYLLRDNMLTQLTQDHSVVEDKIRYGELTRSEAQDHPMSNLITSTIGGKLRIPHLGLKTIALEKRDLLLLVSDGISGVLNPEEIKNYLSQGVDALIRAAQEAHSLDDCSVIIVSVG